VNSILNNSAALSALQSLNMTQQSLATVQNQVSTGLSVANASDNAAYWSIATQLTSDSGMVSASNSALSQSQAALDTANTAIQSIITTINSIQQALTEAANPGASLTDINTTLSSLGQQLTDAVSGASFNGVNVLDGSQGASMSFVSGYDAANNNVTTIDMSLQAVYTATPGGGAGAGILFATGTYSPPSGSSAVGGGQYDLTLLGSTASGGTTIDATNVQDILTSVNSALSNITNYSAQLGATQDRMSSMNNLNQALTTNYANGVQGLVDADMNTASTRLQALQTQEQLGIQALSIANQNAQLILKLFP
jgi:flagellin